MVPISQSKSSSIPLLVDVQQVGLRLQRKTILDGINLQIQRGEIVTIIGPNGAGKTALLKVILGLYQPSSGKVLLAKGLRIGYMPQVLMVESLMPLTVERFLLLSPRANITKCTELSRELGILHLLQSAIQTISGG